MADSYDTIFSPERRQARRYDTPYRSRRMTDQVYREDELTGAEGARFRRNFFATQRSFYPEPSRYNIYFGELHGHSCLSDGQPDPDAYFQHIRDVAKLDFAALTDHTHGGLASATLYGPKGDALREATIRYNQPGKFSTIFGYEIEAYPYYNNAVVYHSDFTGELFRTSVDGDITAQELKALLNRADRLLIPHDTYHLESGADFEWMDPTLFTPLIEIYSCGDSAEYFGNPQNVRKFGMCRGGCWQDALRRGAKMGCIAASDDHCKQNGIITDAEGINKFPGITGVLCEENTTEAIFRALKARRCYGFMGGRVWMDFRINGHYMGEEFASDGDRHIYFKVSADAPLKKITLVKNCEDYLYVCQGEGMVFDYHAAADCDSYYLRVELEDGRLGWTSPIWVHRK
ncbi:MAG: hypothetical protein IJY28_03780 [Clostridia bacterium]|nr:hypothetical protein [Clostridia bacterium]